MSPVTSSGTSRRGFLMALVSLAGLSVACTVKTPEPVTPEPELSDTLQPATSTTATTTRSTPPGGSQTATFVPAVPTASTPQPQATIAPEPMATATDIIQPATPNEESFVQYAFEMRRLAIDSGDQAYGAIIVKDDRVVGLGPSRVVINHDATAHAEMEAIRDASRRLGAADLSGCVMYSTSRPCHMCETASYWARITRMYYGPNASDAGAPQYSSC